MHLPWVNSLPVMNISGVLSCFMVQDHVSVELLRLEPRYKARCHSAIAVSIVARLVPFNCHTLDLSTGVYVCNTLDLHYGMVTLLRGPKNGCSLIQQLYCQTASNVSCAVGTCV